MMLHIARGKSRTLKPIDDKNHNGYLLMVNRFPVLCGSNIIIQNPRALLAAGNSYYPAGRKCENMPASRYPTLRRSLLLLQCSTAMV